MQPFLSERQARRPVYGVEGGGERGLECSIGTWLLLSERERRGGLSTVLEGRGASWAWGWTRY